MHPVWNIPELLAYILSFLDDKSHLLQCALVCRAFSVEAARLIWKTVEDFCHLFGCFPNNTISMQTSGDGSSSMKTSGDDSTFPTRTFLFLHTPDPAEWNHMRFRAGMIKELTFSEFDDYDAILEMIHRQKIDLTFPELVSLHFYIAVPNRFQTFLPLFATSRLQELDISFDGSNDGLINAAMETLLAQAHPLRSLEIGATSFPELSQNYAIQLLETTPSINSLCLGLPTLDGEEMVEVAGRLPNLQNLRLEFCDNDGERATYSPGFRSLVSLDAWAQYTIALAIVQAMTSPNIASLQLNILDEIIEPLGNLFDSIATMANLNCVVLFFHDSEFPQWEDVEPLLSCPLISNFHVNVAGAGMELDDEVILAITRAWPNLTRLRLVGSGSAPKRFIRPSLHGLAVLLAGCPRLQELHLEIDAEAEQLRAALATTTPTSSEPRGWISFHARRSPITQNSEEAIAEYLLSLWPGGWDVRTWWGAKDWEGETWGKVYELLQQESDVDMESID